MVGWKLYILKMAFLYKTWVTSSSFVEHKYSIECSDNTRSTYFDGS